VSIQLIKLNHQNKITDNFLVRAHLRLVLKSVEKRKSN